MCVCSVSSVAQLCPTLCNPMNHSTPDLPVHHPTPGVHPNPCLLSRWCHPTISSCRPLLLLPSILPSFRVFSNESVFCIRWPKYWSFSFNISPSNEYSGWISFMIDWFDLLTVQGTLKSLLQHQRSKASSLVFSFLYGSAHKSIHDYWKNHALTRWTFVSKVMSLFIMCCLGWS